MVWETFRQKPGPVALLYYREGPRSHVPRACLEPGKKHAAKSRRSCRPPGTPRALYYEALPASRGRPYAPQRWDGLGRHEPKLPHQRYPASRTVVGASPAGQRRRGISDARYGPPHLPNHFVGWLDHPQTEDGGVWPPVGPSAPALHPGSFLPFLVGMAPTGSGGPERFRWQ